MLRIIESFGCENIERSLFIGITFYQSNPASQQEYITRRKYFTRSSLLFKRYLNSRSAIALDCFLASNVTAIKHF
ncbi:MAG: hypothetical protein RMY64_09855 [Nostoc sp. DedQUE08]|uniref:hypothetical protein n=1 Tax=unclassified Nostoc TaxID=2593658 RepID=UPI002AD57697|nr:MULTISPECIES: hypothetical protein [unclassified Nostoc]MDZ8036008.1 hypothetical protein [Nostoc sp. DedSLP04]MDZ8065931.1 hypothetical protein [Nostoc sp. DedQUE08]MDZ8094147.1 hypothetical protein [Nostoc sp. DedQUE05]MDZ8132449.1 hypothetical protein [Nostoc sp. DedQUE07]